MSLSRALAALPAVLLAAAAHAVPYDPGPGDWWQLQRGSTPVCQQGAPCNIAPGEYRLLRFGSSGVRETRVAIAAPPSAGTPSVRVVERSCRQGPFDRPACTAACPAGTTIVAVAGCGAAWVRRVLDEADADEDVTRLPTTFRTNAREAQCAFGVDSSDPRWSRYVVEVTVQASCLR